jgi:hypothetical protein
MMINEILASNRGRVRPCLPPLLLVLIGACDAAAGAPAQQVETQKSAVSIVEGTPPSAASDQDSQFCGCPEVYQPVCGVDNVTYASACFAACARVAVQYEGECKTWGPAGAGDLTVSRDPSGPPPCESTGESTVTSADALSCDPCVRREGEQLVPVCAAGETCVAEQVVCVQAPCPPIAHCEPA